MEFLCDEMLARLGRWLRIAGYDTLIASDGADDRALFETAQSEGRLLLTCDRKLLEYRDAKGVVVLVQGNSLQEYVQDVTQKLSIDWQFRPFSRCSLCNTPLLDVARERWQGLPQASQARATQVLACPRCHRLYWDGSHVRRIRQQLAIWQNDR